MLISNKSFIMKNSLMKRMIGFNTINKKFI